MAKKKTMKTSEITQVPIKWNVPENIITRFASNMVVQQTEDYFKLSFFELKPEINLAIPELPPTEMVADCVASVVVTPMKLLAIANVLKQQVEMYKKKLEATITAPSEPEQPS